MYKKIKNKRYSARFFIGQVIAISWWIGLMLFFPAQAYSNDNSNSLTIAVASDFYPTLQKIAKKYTQQTGAQISISSGATDKIYLDIVNGAPYDIFFSADSQHPHLLITQHLADSSSQITYAIGALVLWVPGHNVQQTGLSYLHQNQFHYLAIANPEYAPYGRAALQFLQQTKLSTVVKSKIIMGDNISQAFSFVISHNAEAGLVAYSQTKNLALSHNLWVVPAHYYQPIRQQALILSHCQNSALAHAFMHFLTQPAITQLIKQAGYQT